MENKNSSAYSRQRDEFINEILVVCPACSKRAKVLKTILPVEGSGTKTWEEYKIVCAQCGYNRKRPDKPHWVNFAKSIIRVPSSYAIFGGAYDPYFRLPLWLTIECGGHLLWAFNYEHLQVIKNHVAARLRERDLTNISNRSIGSRLPRWISAAKHREIILKAIAQLEQK